MFELAKADVGGVAVAADTDDGKLTVGDGSAGGDGGHAAVEAVEAVAVLEEIGGGFAGAADAADLGSVEGIEADLLAGFDQGAGDTIVAAALAEGGCGALIGEDSKGERLAAGFADEDGGFGGHGRESRRGEWGVLFRWC